MEDCYSNAPSNNLPCQTYPLLEMKKKRIFIACGDERLRTALFLHLDHRPGMAVVGITDRLESLVIQLEASQACILLLEWQLTRQAMFDLMAGIRSLLNPPHIIYFSGGREEEQEIQTAGATFVILKSAPPDELLPIIEQISRT
jgi:DNA-binding NarL/FixJ family response regulator